MGSPFEQYNAANRVLVLTSRAFDFAPRRLPPNVRYVGTPFDDADVPASTWQPHGSSDDPRPLVLVSLSTMAQGQAAVMHRVLAAVASLPTRVVVTLGPSLGASEFAAPPNVTLETFVPHAAVLPHVTAMVTQCGLGTTMKVLAHGVPLICMPLVGDQLDNAARVVARGAGVRLGPDATPDQIRAAIQQVLREPSFRDRARHLGAAFAAQDGARTAADELESLATMGT
jgi:MGT family glycosyltransferase